MELWNLKSSSSKKRLLLLFVVDASSLLLLLLLSLKMSVFIRMPRFCLRSLSDFLGGYLIFETYLVGG